MRVLVLESDPATFLALGQLFKLHHIKLTVNKNKKVDVAIIDFHSVDFPKLKSWCAKHYKDTKIIMTSTFSESKLDGAKYHYFLRKPYGIDNILELIGRK